MEQVTAYSSDVPGYPSSGDWTFSQQLSLDLSSDYEDEADMDNYSSDSADLSVVDSSLLYEEGCVVSAHTIMRGGGGCSTEETLVSPLDELDSLFRNPGHIVQEVMEEDEEDEDNDDDDDNDDGHSSMLSNASLRRVRSNPLVVRGGATGGTLGQEAVRRLFVVALVTLVFEGMIGHVLEFLKIAMQTAPPDTTYRNVISDITSEKGIAGLWDGECRFTRAH